MWKTLKQQRAEEVLTRYQELSEDLKKNLCHSLPRKEVNQSKDISYTNSFILIQEMAKDFAKQHKKTIDDVSIEHSYYEDYNNTSSEMHLETMGLETDEQYYRRLLEYHEASKSREQWERKEFERLKTKFEE